MCLRDTHESDGAERVSRSSSADLGVIWVVASSRCIRCWLPTAHSCPLLNERSRRGGLSRGGNSGRGAAALGAGRRSTSEGRHEDKRQSPAARVAVKLCLRERDLASRRLSCVDHVVSRKNWDGQSVCVCLKNTKVALRVCAVLVPLLRLPGLGLAFESGVWTPPPKLPSPRVVPVSLLVPAASSPGFRPPPMASGVRGSAGGRQR